MGSPWRGSRLRSLTPLLLPETKTSAGHVGWCDSQLAAEQCPPGNPHGPAPRRHQVLLGTQGTAQRAARSPFDFMLWRFSFGTVCRSLTQAWARQQHAQVPAECGKNSQPAVILAAFLLSEAYCHALLCWARPDEDEDATAATDFYITVQTQCCRDSVCS